MNENRRGDDFNEIISLIKELFDKYSFCEVEVTDRESKNYSTFPPLISNHNSGKKTTVTLTFR